ncbi:RNA-binding transcriptional accessory protein [Alicyclobacillus fastidiosus]|uniref:RNA-binding transcriptional accessory protein n=1 Tax=Alicyclobacillus fastidiosus TaxID=392011 RepID=A0ABY6ZFU9_9BACL|nr:Tex family protein [Alicyclobacillus fastidiosus]WAH40985.1 RNA-binding transcriptional accessory protein [Alicyclobacillus fastidiosus]GMA62499.1 RNA-binding transcriptional accessory protein [Alicyclobacillus fastidiosus]
MFELSTPDYIKEISNSLSIAASQVRAAVRLMDEGNTIPFIARYRKEMTGELDENQLRDIANRYESEKSLFGRKQDVVRLLEEHGALADEAKARELVAAVMRAGSMTEVDDIYRPYRPKRKTRASVAKERGLEPLAIWLRQPERSRDGESAIRTYAQQFVSEELGVSSVEEAVQGACDIFAESVADDPASRRWVRQTTVARGTLQSVAVDANVESVYEAYYEFSEPIAKAALHRVLAMNRGEREQILRISVAAPQDLIVNHLCRMHIHSRSAGTYIGDLLTAAVVDAYKRLVAPAIERDIRAELTARAEDHAISIFGENLKNLLMQPPIRNRVVLGVDPAYRTGCKLAVIDDIGKLLEVSVIYPTPPENRVEDARRQVLAFIRKYGVGLIAIGNGTASRETEAFIAACLRQVKEEDGALVPYLIVSEAGASVYSASPLAGEEFPHLDVSERSAVSIARRVQDPLAELVKIDPKSVGVGQYQHDVTQKKLDEQLAVVVETAVNHVGVDVNTASPSLLSYVAGLNKAVARNIVEYREKNGRFHTRKALGKVPRLGPKTLEQCVGFLRIPDGDEVLDATPIHPESYHVVNALLERWNRDERTLRDAQARAKWLSEMRATPLDELSRETGFGEPTLRDIMDALYRPGRDPREDVPAPILRTDVLKLEDLEVGMTLSGTVRNVVDFGAFVDIGVKNDGLVHISQLADHYVKHPMDVVSVGDVVQVRVIQVDLQKGRLGLSMKKQAD